MERDTILDRDIVCTMTDDPYPLLFEPIYKPKPWGGRRLQSVMGRTLSSADFIGESWELSDLDGDPSVIRNGPAKGWTLRRAMQEWGSRLTGRMPLCGGRFPLLVKYLDAREALSIQVHPSSASFFQTGDTGADYSRVERPGAGECPPSDIGGSPVSFKDEAWYILESQPGGCIYRGVRPGVDLSELRAALVEGDVDRVIRRVQVKAGQAYYLPAGIVHALGAGVLVAEVQTPCDTTYRLYDWGRVDPATGRGRDLHLDEGLACVRFDLDPAPAEQRSHVASVWTAVTRLITSPHFRIEHIRMVDGAEQDVPYSEPVVWMMLSGQVEVSCEASGKRVSHTARRGDTLLLPAGLKHPRVRAEGACAWLEITVPTPSDLAEFTRPDTSELRGLAKPSGLVQLGLNTRGQK